MDNQTMQPVNDNKWHGLKPVAPTRRERIVDGIVSYGALLLGALLWLLPVAGLLKLAGFWFWN